MNRISAPLYLATILLPLAALAGRQEAACGAGKLLDVQVETRILETGTMQHGRQKEKKDHRREYDTYTTVITQKQTTYSVTVQLGDRVYTAQSEAIFGFGFKPTSFIVNDPIQGCVRGDKLALTRPDGKEYKAHIVRILRSTDSKQ